MNFEKSTERVVDFSIRCTRCGYDLVGFADPKCPRCGKENPTRTSKPDDGEESGGRQVRLWIAVGVVLLMMIAGLLVGAILY